MNIVTMKTKYCRQKNEVVYNNKNKSKLLYECVKSNKTNMIVTEIKPVRVLPTKKTCKESFIKICQELGVDRRAHLCFSMGW